MECTTGPHAHTPWNKGKLVGQKAPFKPQEVWAIRVRLQMENRPRELALFDLGIDSKLRACDLVKLRVRDVCHGDRVASQRTRRYEVLACSLEAHLCCALADKQTIDFRHLRVGANLFEECSCAQ